MFVVTLPLESVKVYVYGGVPPNTVIGPNIPDKSLHFELVILTNTLDIPAGVNNVVDEVALHKPASVTSTVNSPGDKLVKITVLSKLYGS